MCGRFTLRTPTKDVADLFDLPPDAFEQAGGLVPRYNVAPTQEIAAVRASAERSGREVAWLRWGLVPHWAEGVDAGPLLFNARSETVATKPAFREPLRSGRCLIPADGFYEWKKAGRSRQPFYIRLKSDRPFAFAGLWDRWQRGGDVIQSCTIITTEANDLLRELHERMPVLLDPEQFAEWLNPASEDPRTLEPLLAPYPAERMVKYPVSRKVNSGLVDAPECMTAAIVDKTQRSLFE